jgi:hypothetical protein
MTGDGAPLMEYCGKLRGNVSSAMGRNVCGIARKAGFVAVGVLCCYQPLMFAVGFLSGALAKRSVKNFHSLGATQWKELDFRIQCLAVVIFTIMFMKFLPAVSMIAGNFAVIHTDAPQRRRATRNAKDHPA